MSEWLTHREQVSFDAVADILREHGSKWLGSHRLRHQAHSCSPPVLALPLLTVVRATSNPEVVVTGVRDAVPRTTRRELQRLAANGEVVGKHVMVAKKPSEGRPTTSALMNGVDLYRLIEPFLEQTYGKGGYTVVGWNPTEIHCKLEV